MRLEKHSPQQAWSSPTYKKLRQQLLQSERPEMCQRCFREEDSGVESSRQKWSKKWAHKNFQNPEPDFDVKYFDLRLGNLCNLKCRMCNPYASSKWVDEWNRVSQSAELVPNSALDDEEIKRLKNQNWPERQETWKNLEQLLDSVEEIYLTGGEPFLSLKQVSLLDELVQTGRSKAVILKYNTNLTVLPKKLVDLWPHFKSVKLNVSIDGVDKLNDYIRYPAKWDTIERHLNQILELEKQASNIVVGIHTTVQMYNILHLAKIISYFRENFKKTPYLNILNHPHCLNIRTLPKNLKQEVTLRLKKEPSETQFHEVISYMNSEDWYENHYREFLSYTEALDQIRGESLSELLAQTLPSVTWDTTSKVEQLVE